MAAAELTLTKELAEEAKSRFQDAKRQKAMFRQDFEECYWFTAPLRQRAMSSDGTQRGDARPDDAPELSTSIGFEVNQDFATELENTFLPKGIEWVSQKPSAQLPAEGRVELERKIRGQTKAVFSAIRESNFDSAVAMSFVPDAGIGTVAVWIDDSRPPGPFVCQALPLTEIETNVGPHGEVDDRFLVRSTRYRHLQALLPGVTLPPEIAKKVREKPRDKCVVTWGFWRDWSYTADIRWKGVTRVGETPVAAATYTGAGSCPMIVGRFGASPLYSFGIGPTLQSLAELRSLDEVSLSTLERLDIATNPPFGYPDDGVVNFEGGVMAGMGYPMRPGSGQDFVPLYFKGDVDTTFMGRADLERRIKRLHFVDKPEQRGDTPPTATQWLDEMALAQRRIGTPGAMFWREFPAEVFQRFRYLLTLRGTLPAVEVDGRALALEPYNPAEKAREMQEVEIGVRLLDIITSRLPQIAPVLIDAVATAENLKTKLGDEIVILNSQDQIKTAIEQFSSLLGESTGNVQSRGGIGPGE